MRLLVQCQCGMARSCGSGVVAVHGAREWAWRHPSWV